MYKLFCCCRSTKFARSIEQGKGMIRRELDLFNFLTNQRKYEANLQALTTFDQRRLIKQQVRAGLLVAPIKSKNTGRRNDAKLWDSEDEETSSDEDFHWLTKRLHEEEGQLDDETMRLLRGVVTQFYKDRKHPERYNRPGEIISTEEDKDDEEG